MGSQIKQGVCGGRGVEEWERWARGMGGGGSVSRDTLLNLMT